MSKILKLKRTRTIWYKGGKCEGCGSKDMHSLELYRISDRVQMSLGDYAKAQEELIEEANNCILLCGECHDRSSIKGEKD